MSYILKFKIAATMIDGEVLTKIVNGTTYGFSYSECMTDYFWFHEDSNWYPPSSIVKIKILETYEPGQVPNETT